MLASLPCWPYPCLRWALASQQHRVPGSSPRACARLVSLESVSLVGFSFCSSPLTESIASERRHGFAEYQLFSRN